MPHFFKHFPKVEYDIKKNGKTINLTNITQRFKIKENLKNRGIVFYEYTVKDSDRPDIIAEKLYGDGTLDWIIFLVNDIIDPIHDWPLKQEALENFISKKYGSISLAQATDHSFRSIIRKQRIDSEGNSIPAFEVEIDETTYNSLPATSRRKLSQYDFEFEENEKKRRIKLIDTAYINSIINEYKTVLK